MQESKKKLNKINRLKSLAKSPWKRDKGRNVQDCLGGWTQARKVSNVGDDISISAGAPCWGARSPQTNTPALLLGLKVMCLPALHYFLWTCSLGLALIPGFLHGTTFSAIYTSPQWACKCAIKFIVGGLSLIHKIIQLLMTYLVHFIRYSM